MIKPLDKIYEAYFNSMGEKFGEKVRKRIHWICQKAEGEKILDIGCSQGIASILLGREGKSVLGLDLLEESIEFAKEMLAKEESTTKERVIFKSENFMNFDFKDEKYDTILLTEVLEHVTDPKRFVDKAKMLLKNNGRMVVTVPFGINDYFDHKKTYYVNDILELIPDDFEVKDLNIMGSWVGVVAKKSSNKENSLEYKYFLKKAEEGFFTQEQELLKFKKRLQKNISVLKEEKQLSERKLEKLEVLEKANETLEKKLEKANKEIEKLKLEQLKLLNSEEKALLELKKVVKKNNILSNSKLGRLTIKYWDFRNNIKKKRGL
ncbi:hypothetical protein PM10SUCC1_22980 [Propionigenium maris DSM 9537]|uniref:Methyltransferase domain-containing protein n=1 Tax=Propionigenium maris DSM 9537 TaxID=1123000 RepID=A0A9W6GKF9_9FUSO|nr:methyltransferase domain-containing protein [Propionigenium maris]GLI56784.1 hypothetical protein PM10SUCC1_22980 [Propionigenium maris DSM 9537]